MRFRNRFLNENLIQNCLQKRYNTASSIYSNKTRQPNEQNDHRITHNNNDKDNLDDDFSLFRDEVKGVKVASGYHTPRTKQKSQAKETRRTEGEFSDKDFYFSDEFIPHLTDEGPTRYARSDVSKYEVKRLRRGVYVPDVFWICTA
ncbi:hypothetical protein HND97_13310 [Vibrio cholerae]|nr:hypothetical protein HND97_13310 [Vibrio cholerae]